MAVCVSSLPIMTEIDLNQQWRELQESYSAMSDEELQTIADDSYDLTDVAKQALQAEISRRHLKIELQQRAPEAEEEEKPPEGYPPGFNPEDWGLTNFSYVNDPERARKIKECFDEAGIPSYLGPDLVDDVRLLPSSFQGSLQVKVREVDLNRARAVMKNCSPEPEDDDVEIPDYSGHCPKCHSTEIVLQGLDEPVEGSATAPKFTWSCDACGHQWKDDGIESET